MGLKQDSRLARLERVGVAPAPPEPAPEDAARTARYWEAFEQVLNRGMPRAYALQVVAELDAAFDADQWPPVRPSPLASRVMDLAWQTSRAETFGYEGPLVIPPGHCRVLVEHPYDVSWWSQLACRQCKLESPTHQWGTLTGSVAAPWFHRCAHCGGALAHHRGTLVDWIGGWWIDEAGVRWHWQPEGPTRAAAGADDR